MVFRISILAAAMLGGVLSHQVPSPRQVSTPVSGTGLIVGRVVDGTTGSPVTNVSVTIGGTGAPRTNNAVLVDSQGRFVFRSLPAGSFTLTAQKNGYMNGAFGRLRPGGAAQMLTLGDGERVIDATIHVWRFGSITGTVVDEAGEPVAGARLSALAIGHAAGAQNLGSNSSDTTDDRGMYRLASLMPGEYIVAMWSRVTTFPVSYLEADNAARATGAPRPGGNLTVGTFPAAPATRIGDFLVARFLTTPAPTPLADERLSVFPIAFYPSAASTDSATPIHLAAGQQQTGADLQVRLVPAIKISGVVTGPE